MRNKYNSDNKSQLLDVLLYDRVYIVTTILVMVLLGDTRGTSHDPNI